MHFSTIFAATAIFGAAFAEDHTIAVSDKDGQLVFNPDSLEAAQGDNIMFKFWPKNHSVAQAAFASPCEPLDNGFWTGFVPTTDTQKAAEKTYMMTVRNASQPIWFYCTQGKHCQSGMVGVINPPSSGQNTLEAFKSAAASASSNVSPTSSAGTGLELMNSTSGSPSSSASGSAESTGAASTVNGGMAFTGLMGMFAYLMM